MKGAPTGQRRAGRPMPAPPLWLAVNLVVAALGLSAQIVWVYNGPDVCQLVMPAVENCFRMDRWHSIRGGLVLVVLVAVVTIAISASTRRRRWHAACAVIGSLLTILITVLVTR